MTESDSPKAAAGESPKKEEFHDAHEEAPPPAQEPSGKAAVRARVWKAMDDGELVNFPKPCVERIPNFMGADQAADRLKTQEFFTKARTVRVNQDKAQEAVRLAVLTEGKRLLVPTPRRQGLHTLITPPENATREDLAVCARQEGVRRHSSNLPLEDKVTVDLVVVGSVAVCKSGARLGKGEGQMDLDWALMMASKSVTADTLVVTTVHDEQLVELDEALTASHDLPVDYIVTPTQVIACGSRAKPAGILWVLLVGPRVQRAPVLQTLLGWEKEAGKDVQLADEKEGYVPREFKPRRERRPPRPAAVEGEEGGGRGARGARGRRPRRPRAAGEEEAAAEQGGEQQEERPPRPARRGGRRGGAARRSEGERSGEEGGAGAGEQATEKRPRRERRGPTKSVYIGGLPRDVRVSQLKAEVRARGVAPLGVVWYGGSGHTFLVLPPEEADAAVAALEGLSLNDVELRVELANRRPRRDRASRSSSPKEKKGPAKKDAEMEGTAADVANIALSPSKLTNGVDQKEQDNGDVKPNDAPAPEEAAGAEA